LRAETYKLELIEPARPGRRGRAPGRRRCTGSNPSTIASAGTRPSTCRVRWGTRSATGIAVQPL